MLDYRRVFVLGTSTSTNEFRGGKSLWILVGSTAFQDRLMVDEWSLHVQNLDIQRISAAHISYFWWFLVHVASCCPTISYTSHYIPMKSHEIIWNITIFGGWIQNLHGSRQKPHTPGLPGAPNPGLSGSNNSRMRSARFAHHRTTCRSAIGMGRNVPWNHEKMWENHEKPSVGHIFAQKRVAKKHHFSGCLTIQKNNS